jgi:hypothetical protein
VERIKKGVLRVATLVARNANEAMVAPVVGSGGVNVWRDSGIWSQAVSFVLVRLEESGFSRREDVCTFNFLYKKTVVNAVLSM